MGRGRETKLPVDENLNMLGGGGELGIIDTSLHQMAYLIENLSNVNGTQHVRLYVFHFNKITKSNYIHLP